METKTMHYDGPVIALSCIMIIWLIFTVISIFMLALIYN